MQMKIEKTMKFDRNKIKELLETENEYIKDLLTTYDVPDTMEDDDLDNYLLNAETSKKKTPTLNDFNKNSRAQSSKELEERLNIIKNKMKTRKKKISERGAKRREMKKLKKNKEIKKILVTAHKSMKNEHIKANGSTIIKSEDDEDKKDVKPQKVRPVFNEEGKIVFSKFDFAAHPGAKSMKRNKHEKVMKNPKDLLKKMKETNQKINELKEKGEEEKAKDLKDELAWKKVFDKVEGKKVKDDPQLLLKAIKKKKMLKQKSKKQWKDREQKVEATIAARQKKRQDNIEKKSKEKKVKKLKNLTKRGRVIPGF